MSRWMLRAAEIGANASTPATVKTAKTIDGPSIRPLLSVVSVRYPDPSGDACDLVSVLSVPQEGTFQKTSVGQRGDWHGRGWVWNENETQTFMVRQARFHTLGLPSGLAEELADQLVARDREGDDRRLCVECRHCCAGPRCVKQLAVLDVLQRCDHFLPPVN